MEQSKRLELTPDELAKVQRARANTEPVKVAPEELFIAEFGYYYGWGGVDAILNNKIDMETASGLLRGAQKVWYSKMIDHTNSTYIATVAGQSGKKGGQVMKKGLGEYIKQAKVEF